MVPVSCHCHVVRGEGAHHDPEGQTLPDAPVDPVDPLVVGTAVGAVVALDPLVVGAAVAALVAALVAGADVGLEVALDLGAEVGALVAEEASVQDEDHLTLLFLEAV